jgi:hypothetical protein
MYMWVLTMVGANMGFSEHEEMCFVYVCACVLVWVCVVLLYGSFENVLVCMYVSV